MLKYDYLVVGCGLFGCVFAQQAIKKNKKVIVIEKRSHIGGNCYTEFTEGIHIHKYGPHIFHTSNERVWMYVNEFGTFNHFMNRPKVKYKGSIFSFPINLMTLYQLWGVTEPKEAQVLLEKVCIPCENPQNLEEFITSKVGNEIFIKGYTQKQWGKQPNELPAEIIKRVPVRLTFDDNYYEDKYQGVPIGGYSGIFKKMLSGVEVKLNTDYFEDKDYWDSIAPKIIFTGKIDEYFNYRFGELEYRSLRFENNVYDGDYQGNAVINHTDLSVPYTRTIEHKHFDFSGQSKTIVTWEYPDDYDFNKTPYYPVNTKTNNNLYCKYLEEAKKKNNVLFSGRLGTYAYLDMDDVILSSLTLSDELLRDDS